MARFSKKKIEEIGLSPYALVFRGTKKIEKVKLRLINYNKESLKEINLNQVDEASSFQTIDSITWVNIDGLYDQAIMQSISEQFNIDSLLLSNVMNTDARPKIFELNNSIYISVKMLRYKEVNEQVISENLVLIIKQNILLTFQELVGDVFEPVRERLRNNRKTIRSSGSDYLAFAILDIVFDHYSYIISRIGEKIEDIDELLLDDPGKEVLENINNYKREIIYLHKAIKPVREMMNSLIKMDSDLFSKKMNVHFKDLQDNITHAHDSLESYREILTEQLNVYHTIMSSKLNDIMKFLTVFSVVFIPLTFIAGVYGTNFDNMPELHYKNSYFVMWGVLIVLATGMILYFKRKKWL